MLRKIDIIKNSDSGADQTSRNLQKPVRMTPEVAKVPITDIRPYEENARGLNLTLDQLKNPESISDPKMQDAAAKILDLADTIRDHGLLQPALGYRTPGGVVRLMAGERRWWACQLAGLEAMDVLVYPDRPAADAEQHLIENIHRSNLSTGGVLRGLQRILERRAAIGQPVTSGKELRGVVRMPKTVAYRWWDVISSDEELKSAVLEDRVPNLRIAHDLARMTPEERTQRIESQQFDDLGNRSKKKSSVKGRTGRPPTSVNLGRVEDTEVVKKIIFTIDPEGDYSYVDWADHRHVGRIWRRLIDRIADETAGQK